jgi:hypothetical protein
MHRYGANFIKCFDQMTSSAQVITFRVIQNIASNKFFPWDIDFRIYTELNLIQYTLYFEEEKIYLYFVHDPTNHDLRAGGQGPKIHFGLFHTFRWSRIYLCHIPFKNAKKSKIGSPYCVHCTI